MGSGRAIEAILGRSVALTRQTTAAWSVLPGILTAAHPIRLHIKNKCRNISTV
jgi:hypothetical protein